MTEPRERCPVCHGRMVDAYTDRAFCGYKGTPGYGPCTNPRPLPTLEEAARALKAAAHGDRDGNSICVPLRNPIGSRRREWDDFAYAVERLEEVYA